MTLQPGFDPLFRSISEGDLPTLKRLFNTGRYSVNSEVWYYSEDEKDYIITPLYWAVKLDQREICGYLLQNGADPFSHMVYEYYPLHEACNKGSVGIIQEFIDAGCNLNKPNCDGDTPLHISCLRGHTECVRVLLGAGGKRNIRNKKGQTPLQVAQFNNHTDLYKLFEREASPTKWQIRERPQVKPRPSSGGPSRRSSFSNPHYHKTARPLSYHSTSQDDTVLNSSNKPSSLRGDVTRTFSFSGSNHYNHVNVSDFGSNAHKDSPLLTKQLPGGSKLRPSNSSAAGAAQRPTLCYMSHDSQLVLPTQRMIPDPRRTQTCFEIVTQPPNLDQQIKSPSPDFDDIEADAIHPRPSSLQGRVRVSHLVECLHPALRPRDTSPIDSNDCRQKVLDSIHREVGFSDEEYCAINQLVQERENSCSDRPSPTGQDDGDLEYVWGCDYKVLNRHPIRVLGDRPSVSCAEMTFHVKLDATGNEGNSLLKVHVQLFDLEDKDQFDMFHSGNHRDLCRVGQIFSSVPRHPNIAKQIHKCSAHSKPFERFTRLFCPEDGHLTLKMSPQCSLVFTEYFSKTLEDFISSKRHIQTTPPFGIPEKSLLSLLAQLLLVMAHLDEYNVLLGQISSLNIFIERNSLYFADFTFAFNLSECSNMTELKAWLQTIPEEVFLLFPPELCQINDSPAAVLDSFTSAKRRLDKCNAFCAGRLFQDLLTTEDITHESSRNFDELSNLSEPFQFLIRRLVSEDHEDRFSSLDGALFCLALLYGPKECRTMDDCQQWLMSETLHLFLQPSLKGHPSDYNQTNTHTKLLYMYLCLATPEKLLSITSKMEEIDIQ